MTIQIRITEQDGSNPVILDDVEARTVFRSINSADEGVAFDIAKNSPKAELVNPDTGGYTRLWEAWDTEKNIRINRGPISSVTEQGPSYKVTGKGRSQFMQDISSSSKTFNRPLFYVVNDLRYENIAIEPRTSTIVHGAKDGDTDEDSVFNNPTIDETFHGLSQRTKDFAIDDYTGYIKPGQTVPSRTYYTAEDFWAGMSTKDSIVVDLGDTYNISKIRALFPWWSGAARFSSRTYDFALYYADDINGTLREVQGKTIGSFNALAQAGFTPSRQYLSDNKIVTSPMSPIEVNIGTVASGSAADFNAWFTKQNQAGGQDMRYIRVSINQVHNWKGSNFDSEASTDNYAENCDPDFGTGGVMDGKEFDDRNLEPAADCRAALVELQALQEIMPQDVIKPLALQKIDNNNLQITYSHTPDASETYDTSTGYRKFEPGSLFRRFHISWSGAGGQYTKFYPKDCTNCYPDGFAFAILDQNNNAIYMTDTTSFTDRSIRSGIFTKHIITKGADDATVTWVDAWRAKLDPLSFGSGYSYTTVVGDTATIHFRGQSFKWFATIPEGETGAQVDIDIRTKDISGTWSGWTSLENNYQLPSGVHAEEVYAISYESGYLEPETVYEIRITNNDGGWCSIDSIEGYWSGSFTMYNEDSQRITLSKPEKFTQIYDKRFSGGSMYKWNNQYLRVGYSWEGDRLIVLSAKGRNHGKISLLIHRTDTYNGYDPGDVDHVKIAGGNADGSITVDLDSGKRGSESAQYILFDSNEHTNYTINGVTFPSLPWGFYGLQIRMLEPETYQTTAAEVESSNFVNRCHSCHPKAGDDVTINKFLYLDAIGAHERLGLSVQFDNKPHLEQLTSIAEALQIEWMVTDEGLRLEPRIGEDTDIVLREGNGKTMVDYNIVNDVTNMATMLISSGADIDGLPLFTITEDKKTREIFGRTVMRQQDFRNTGDYFALIGLSRSELRKRRYPEKRITVTHIANYLGLDEGDSFMLYTKKQGLIRVRIMRKAETESTSGKSYELECIRWPLMA